MNNKLVTIIIPTYKRSDMLDRAITSVLNQSYKEIEIIVVDDNDEESVYRKNTEKLMGKYDSCSKVRYIKHKKNINGAAARNTGIKVANGAYIGFLDDDDEFLADKIREQVYKLDNSSEDYGAIYSGYCVIRGSKVISNVISTYNGDLSKELLLMEWGTGSGSNVLFKKEVFDNIGLFDEKLTRHQDWDILLRTLDKYKLQVIDKPLLKIYKDSRINIPNADKFVEIKNYFLKKFDYKIESFGEECKKNILKKHNLELVIAYLKNKKYSMAIEYYRKCKEYSKISFNEKISLCLIIVFVNLPFKDKMLVFFGSIIERFRVIKS